MLRKIFDCSPQNDQATLLSSDDDGKECDNDEREPIAVLHIYPPERSIRARCVYKLASYDYADFILEDPISMCIVGGLRFKINTFCDEHGKSHGRSVRYNIAYNIAKLGFIVLSAIFLTLLKAIYDEDPFLREWMNRPEWMNRNLINMGISFMIGFVLMISFVLEKVHKTSATYLDSQRNFWHSWREFWMEHKLSEMLESCGYSFEIEEEVGSGFRKISLYKKKGDLQITSLPKGDKTDKAEEVANKRWILFDVDNDGEDVSPNPLDLWTLKGIRLGNTLILASTAEAAHRFILFFGVTVYILGIAVLSPLFFCVLCLLLAVAKKNSILIILIIGVIFCDKPKLFTAMEDLCKRFSPLIHDRHEGYSLLYEITDKPGPNPGMFVLESPPAKNGGMLA